jgi:hypothetical protein
MAIATIQDFQIYDEQFYGGMDETNQQNYDVFNARSAGAIRLVTQMRKGQYEQESFFKAIGSTLVSRRDPTSTADATALKLVQGELVGVKINRKIGPVDVTNDAFRKIQLPSDQFSLVLGRQTGPEVQVDYANTAITAIAAALRGQASLVTDKVTGDGAKTLRHTYLANALAKFGDKASMIVAWVMHSKVYYDLLAQAILDNVFNVAGVAVANGTNLSLGRPVIITDSASLYEASASSNTSYITLGLTADAVVIEESEEREIASRLITGKENLYQEIQGEHAFNLRVKGFAWDRTNGQANPTNAAIGTSTNWDFQMADVKSAGGVLLITD